MNEKECCNKLEKDDELISNSSSGDIFIHLVKMRIRNVVHLV